MQDCQKQKKMSNKLLKKHLELQTLILLLKLAQIETKNPASIFLILPLAEA